MLNSDQKVDMKLVISGCSQFYLTLCNTLTFLSMYSVHFLFSPTKDFNSPEEVLFRVNYLYACYNCFLLAAMLLSQWYLLLLLLVFCYCVSCYSYMVTLSLKSIIYYFRCFFCIYRLMKLLTFYKMIRILERLVFTSYIFDTSCFGIMLRMSLCRIDCQYGSICEDDERFCRNCFNYLSEVELSITYILYLLINKLFTKRIKLYIKSQYKKDLNSESVNQRKEMRKSRVKAETSLKVIGMMSGTSLDGVDLALCEFTRGVVTQVGQSPWRYRLIAAKTFQYPKYVLQTLKTMQYPTTTFMQFKKLQISYTKFIIEIINLFQTQFNIAEYDLLSVHGHTIFHQPQENITVQVGNVNYLAGALRVDVVGNFRELDVFRGGQGAPLAPYGEEIFAGDAFINFGGIANISYRKKGYDINFCNLFFNYFSQKYYHSQFDTDGNFGREGTPNPQVMTYFMNNSAFKLGHSLAREQFETFIHHVQTDLAQFKTADIISSYYHFLSTEIVKTAQQLIKDQKSSTVMCTGGGAKNAFLMELINSKSKLQFIVPNQELIDFKQAIIFAFLGVKTICGEINCSTGVGGNVVRGAITLQKKSLQTSLQLSRLSTKNT